MGQGCPGCERRFLGAYGPGSGVTSVSGCTAGGTSRVPGVGGRGHPSFLLQERGRARRSGSSDRVRGQGTPRVPSGAGGAAEG